MTDYKLYENWRNGEKQTAMLKELLAKMGFQAPVCQWCGVRQAAPNDPRGACTECCDLLCNCC